MAEVPQHHPFRELRTRGHIELAFTKLARLCGGGFYARRGDKAVIGLDPDLDQATRTEAVAHELGHDILPGATEAQINDFVAQWLCPDEPMVQLIASIIDDGRGVEVWEVAEAFNTTERVARRACERIQRKGLLSA